MAARNHLLPTREQCFALTDEQCRKIMDLLDEKGIRARKDWEYELQPELVRLYMTMWSFPIIETYMKPKLEWS